mgnify:CR=1 FL=1
MWKLSARKFPKLPRPLAFLCSNVLKVGVPVPKASKINISRTLERSHNRPGGIRHDDIGEHPIEHVWRRQYRRLSRDPFEDLLRILQC